MRLSLPNFLNKESGAAYNFPWYARLTFAALSALCIVPIINIVSSLAPHPDLGGTFLLLLFVLFFLSGILFSLPGHIRDKYEGYVYGWMLVFDVVINIAVALQ
jgi:hypothetical protein